MFIAYKQLNMPNLFFAQNFTNYILSSIVNIVSSDSSVKKVAFQRTDLQWYHLHLYLISSSRNHNLKVIILKKEKQRNLNAY